MSKTKSHRGRTKQRWGRVERKGEAGKVKAVSVEEEEEGGNRGSSLLYALAGRYPLSKLVMIS